MSNFKVGQTVVCIKRGLWENEDGSFDSYGPKYGEECLITEIKRKCLRLWGYDNDPCGYAPIYTSDNFRSTLGKDATKELVSEFIEVIETSEFPINIPQTA